MPGNDKPGKEIEPEHWVHAEQGMQSIMKGLEQAGVDLSKTSSKELEIYGEEEQRRGLPTGLVKSLGLVIGGQFQLEETLPGDSSRIQKIDGVVTGIFYDGFAFIKLRPKER